MKEHVPKCVKNFIEGKRNIKSAAIMSATRKPPIEEHLVNYQNCGKNYENVRFEIVHQRSNVYDLLKLE